MPTRTLTIPRRFNGPPTSGNGGYVAGAIATCLSVPTVQITLRAPVPLDRALHLHDTPEGGIALHDGELLLAEAAGCVIEAGHIAVPPAPDAAQAEAAGALGRMTARSQTGNPYDHCFGCGIARGDGLQIIPSLLPGAAGEAGVVATTWTPSAELATPDGTLDAPITWAALDCPAGFAWGTRLGQNTPMMTGRMAADIARPLRAGERYVVAGWPIRQDGRKLHAGTAIFDEHGHLRARSLQLWLLLRT